MDDIKSEFFHSKIKREDCIYYRESLKTPKSRLANEAKAE
jgi:hypothetical protein